MKSGNIVLITNGYRTRARDDGSRKCARLSHTEYTSSDSLKVEWEGAVTSIPQEDYVLGSGSPGIFSERFGSQLVQLADRDNVWCTTTGLGLINLGASYPQYDLAEHDADISSLLSQLPTAEGGEPYTSQDWWMFVCGLSGSSFTSVIKDAIKHGRRVLIAMPGVRYYQYRKDFAELITWAKPKSGDQSRMEAIHAHVRCIGPGLEGTVPPELLPCVMPHDRSGLDRAVPGVNSHGTRRLAALFLHVCPTPDNGASTAIDDYGRMEAALADPHFTPISYETGSQTKSSVKRLSPDELQERVSKLVLSVGNITSRIVRIIKHEGYSVSADAVSEAISRLTAVTAPRKGKSRAKKEVV